MFFLQKLGALVSINARWFLPENFGKFLGHAIRNRSFVKHFQMTAMHYVVTSEGIRI